MNLRKVRVIPQVSLGTLGNVTAIVGAVTGAADGQYRAMSLNGTWSLKGATAGEGPIVIGFAHSDYSVTEIKEAIEIQNSINLGDKVAQEQANRLVRIVGTFPSAQVAAEDVVLNDGRPMKTRLNWAIPIGKAVNIFAYNDSGATLTTGAIVDFNGDLWVKDY